MADKGKVFDADSVRRIGNAVRRVEAMPRSKGSHRRRGAASSGAHMQLVEVTSLTQTSGRYPGKLLIRDVSDGSVMDGAVCWVIPPDDEVLAAVRYEARYIGDANGRAVFQAIGLSDGEAYVIVTSLTQVSSRFPGQLVSYNASTRVWTSGDVVWVDRPNAAANLEVYNASTNPRIYHARRVLPDISSVPVYLVDTPYATRDNGGYVTRGLGLHVQWLGNGFKGVDQLRVGMEDPEQPAQIILETEGTGHISRVNGAASEGIVFGKSFGDPDADVFGELELGAYSAAPDVLEIRQAYYYDSTLERYVAVFFDETNNTVPFFIYRGLGFGVAVGQTITEHGVEYLGGIRVSGTSTIPDGATILSTSSTIDGGTW